VLPRYPFGHGLSYSSFAYGSMQLLQPLPPLCGGVDTFDLCVSFNVTNTGARDGADVPQLYVTYPAAADEPPRQLRFFSKVKQPALLQRITPQCQPRARAPCQSRATGHAPRRRVF
jgi:hypothetical protein